MLTVGLVGLSIFLAIFGVFGTAVVVMLCAISEVVSQSIMIQRLVLYLENNEAHDACMLIAAHENAIEWHLYIGDREVVDTLLNKPMIILTEGMGVRIAALWFRCAHIIQLTGVTFVAARKGWDGVCLVFLLIVHYALFSLFSHNALVSDWPEREHIDIKVERFEFSGRYPMIGAIQLLSGTKTDSWMNEILVPYPRRDFWLEILTLPEGWTAQYPDGFSELDKEKIERNATTAKKAADVIKREISGSIGRLSRLPQTLWI